MANKGIGYALLGIAVVGVAAAASKKKSGEPMTSTGPGPGLTSDEKGRVEAALTALRALVTAPDKHRRNLILAFQTAARIPQTGSLDPMTMEAIKLTVQNQPDETAILEGVKSLQPQAYTPPNRAPEHEADAPPSAPRSSPQPSGGSGPTPQPSGPTPQPSGGSGPTSPALSPEDANTAVRTLAEAVARSIEARGNAYEKEIVRAFQRAAKLNPDGIYGPNTRAALIAAGIAPSRIPEKLKASLSFLAEVVARNLAIAGNKYDRQAVQRFQAAAGIKADGIYGPNTRAALIKAGVSADRLPAQIK